MRGRPRGWDGLDPVQTRWLAGCANQLDWSKHMVLTGSHCALCRVHTPLFSALPAERFLPKLCHMLDCIRKGAVTNPYREGRNISWSARGAIAFRPDHSQEIFGGFFGYDLGKRG